MRSGAAHASKELLHGETPAGHLPEHPSFRLQGLRLQRFEINGLRHGERLRALGEGIGSESHGAIGYHCAVHPAAGDIGKERRKLKALAPGSAVSDF